MKKTSLIALFFTIFSLSACVDVPDAQRQKVIQELNSFNQLCHDSPTADECKQLWQGGSGA